MQQDGVVVESIAMLRLFMCFLLLVTGCSATIGRSAAQPTDAGVQDVANLVVQVHTGPLVPTGLGEGFRVRAENAAGVAVEEPTDVNGIANLQVDPSAGPWDVTAARAAYTAVSVMGVVVPAHLDVYSWQVQTQMPPMGVDENPVTGAIHNRSVMGSDVIIEGLDGTQATPQDSYMLTFPYWAGAPPMQVIALEMVNDQIVNAGITTPVARLDQPMTIDVDLPSPPVAPITHALTVQFPVVGLTAGNTVTAVTTTSVAHFHASAAGVAVDPVGTSNLGLPVQGNAVWTVTSFPGALAPDLVFAEMNFSGAGAPLLGWVATRLDMAGVTPVFGVVNGIAVHPASDGPVTFETQSNGYFHAAFIVRDTNTAIRWAGYQWDASDFHLRSLPGLPTVVGGRRAVVPPGATLNVCVLTPLPAAAPPWEAEVETPLLASLLGVCTTSATPVQ